MSPTHPLVGKLVFRRNLQIRVDDNYVKSIATDEFDNNFCGAGVRIMVGLSAKASDARLFPPVEQHALGDYVSAYPLAFRLFPRDLERWRSVVWACGMYRPPRDVGDFDGTVGAREVESSEEISVASSHVGPKSEVSVQTDSMSSVTSSEESFVESSVTSEPEIVHHIPPREVEEEVVEKDVAPPVKKDKRAVELAAVQGDFENWRFHGEGEMKDPETGKSCYEGQWKDGQRYGPLGKSDFRDSNGDRWKYEGGFWMDDFAGPGKLVLDEGHMEKELKKSDNPSDKYRIVGFEGNFELPRNKAMLRRNSLPYDDKPTVEIRHIAKMYKKDGQKLKHTGSHISSDSSSDQDDEFRKVLVLDDRRALSACGDETALAAPMKSIAANYNRTRGQLDTPEDSPDLIQLRSDKSSRSIEDAHCGPDQYLGYATKWARALDPNLGFAGLGERLGTGTVMYADGCQFHKMDVTPLVRQYVHTRVNTLSYLTHDIITQAANRPNGRGYFYCPRCPLKFDGHFLNGKPEGKGIMEFEEGVFVSLLIRRHCSFRRETSYLQG